MHYTKNSYSRVSRTEAIGAQRAEEEISPKTNQIPREPNCGGSEQKVRKCYECGIMLKDTQLYIIDWINQDLQALCIGCHAEQPGKERRKLKKRRTYKRFMERYGKEWRRCRE
jgi:hypothetical protein